MAVLPKLCEVYQTCSSPHNDENFQSRQRKGQEEGAQQKATCLPLEPFQPFSSLPGAEQPFTLLTGVLSIVPRGVRAEREMRQSGTSGFRYRSPLCEGRWVQLVQVIPVPCSCQA